MKSKFNVLVLMIVAISFFASCEEESLVEYEDQNVTQDEFVYSKRGSSSTNDCFVTPGMVFNGSMINPQYTVYAAAGGNIVSYDRQIEIYLVATDEFGSEYVLDTAIVTIPANENVSNNISVNGCGTTVAVKIANVSGNGGIDNSCVWRETVGHFVNDCPTPPRDDEFISPGMIDITDGPQTTP